MPEGTIRLRLEKNLKRFIKTTLLRPILWSSLTASCCRFFLTFDDGPDPVGTPALLNVLDTHGAKATFFWVGKKMEQYPWLCRDTVKRGHMICNHTFSHARLKGIPNRQIRAEIESTDDLLSRYSPAEKFLIRPPYGDIGIQLILYAIQHSRRLVLWSLDPEDFRVTSAAALENYFEQNPIRSGDIVLLHEEARYTAQALGSILSSTLARGLSAVTLDQLWPITSQFCGESTRRTY